MTPNLLSLHISATPFLHRARAESALLLVALRLLHHCAAALAAWSTAHCAGATDAASLAGLLHAREEALRAHAAIVAVLWRRVIREQSSALSRSERFNHHRLHHTKSARVEFSDILTGFLEQYGITPYLCLLPIC